MPNPTSAAHGDATVDTTALLSSMPTHPVDPPPPPSPSPRLLGCPQDGMKMQGYNGSQLWDTAFAMQAFAASRLAETLPQAAAAAAVARRTPAKAAAMLGASHAAGGTAHPDPANLSSRLDTMVSRAYAFFDASQIKDDVPNRTRFFRTVSKGGWPFSTNGA